MDIACHVVQDQVGNLTVRVEHIVAHHVLGELHPGQPLRVDPDGRACLIGINDLDIICQDIVTQSGAGGVHLAGKAHLRQPLDLQLVISGHHAHQIAFLQASGAALIAVGVAVCGHHSDGAGGIAVIVSVVIGQIFHLGNDAVDQVAVGLGLAQGRHTAVAAQQQRDPVAYGIAAQIGQGIGRLGGFNGIALACHRHGGGGGGRGADGLQQTGHLVGIGPDGTHGLRPVDHILRLNVVQIGGTAVAVDCCAAGGKGNLGLPAGGGHHGALHGGIHQGYPVQLSVGVDQVQGGLQGVQMVGPGLVLGDHQIIKEV